MQAAPVSQAPPNWIVLFAFIGRNCPAPGVCLWGSPHVPSPRQGAWSGQAFLLQASVLLVLMGRICCFVLGAESALFPEQSKGQVSSWAHLRCAA